MFDDIRESVYGIMAIVFSFVLVYFISNYFRDNFIDYYVPVGRLAFLFTGGLFMLIFRYSLFRNWKYDFAFIWTLIMISLSLLIIPASSSVGQFINLIILAPFVEEFFFRGFMLGLIYYLMKREEGGTASVSAMVLAIVFTLASFTLMHPLSEYWSTLLYGFYFTTIFLAYRALDKMIISKYALFFAVVPHLMNNLIVLIYGTNFLIGQGVVIGTVVLLLGIWAVILFRDSSRLMRTGMTRNVDPDLFEI